MGQKRFVKAVELPELRMGMMLIGLQLSGMEDGTKCSKTSEYYVLNMVLCTRTVVR